MSSNGFSVNHAQMDSYRTHRMQNLAQADTYIKNSDVKFLEDVFDIMMDDAIIDGTDAKNPKVIDFKFPKELLNLIDLKLGSEGCTNEDLVKNCKDIVKYSVKTGHPYFMNQIFAGTEVHGLAGAWITESLNTSQYTYEMAPVFTLMEIEVLKQLGELAGFQESDGLFSPGGSISNMYGLNLARYFHFPEVKTEGMQSLPKICLFTSKLSHYSVKKACALLGMGLNALRYVPCDDQGKMIPEKLEEMVIAAKEEGVTPFFVNATSGTTVAGAFDPLNEIADICERHNLWLHVDGCWGGGLLFSKQQRHKLSGIHRADSMAWNAHKLLGAQLQCCAFITKHKNLLKKAHSADAQYLFQQDKFYDIAYDTGDKSIQCGRKVDVLKFWMMWKSKGSAGLESDVDHLLSLAKYFNDKIQTLDGFRMAYENPQCTNICFWFIPADFREREENDQWWSALAKVAPLVKERMIRKGSMMVSYNPDGSKVNFFRVLLSNTHLRQKDCDFIIQEIENLANDIKYSDLI